VSTAQGRGDGTPDGVPQCHDEVCITCSDTAVAVTIVRLLDDDLALVDPGSGGPMEEVSVALVSAGIGDTILVHAREAIAVTGGSGPSGSGPWGPGYPREGTVPGDTVSRRDGTVR
jgi:hydrogenase expression/formation protein HypC